VWEKKYLYKYKVVRICYQKKFHRNCCSAVHTGIDGCTGWRRLMGYPKLQIIFHRRATRYRALLREMTYGDKGSYESSPPCTSTCKNVRMSAHASFPIQHTATRCNTLQQLQHTSTHCNTLQHTAIHCNTLQHIATCLQHRTGK